jgi:hypothetical protein
MLSIPRAWVRRRVFVASGRIGGLSFRTGRRRITHMRRGVSSVSLVRRGRGAASSRISWWRTSLWRRRRSNASKRRGMGIARSRGREIFVSLLLV